ncbi:MAG TPA: hypothetical protein VLO11_04925 [Luteolibacter sp.]|nr:hypothetical protein [Luteolibacter sp.]
MPETAENVRRWNGYVCPDCRFVFRVARDHDGDGVVCPGCHRLLRVPGSGETLPALVIPLPPAADPAMRRRKRRRRSRHGESGDWESEGESRHHKRDTLQMRWILIGGACALALCVAAVLYAMHGAPDQSAALQAPVAAAPLDDTVAAAAELSDAAFLALAEPLAEKFLAARSVEELLPLVREPERAAPRMRVHYGDDAIEPEGLSLFNTRATVLREGAFLTLVVRTRDFEEKIMAFVNTSEGLRIDWEGWVGWSAMAWEDFLAEKPTAPTLFRVVLRPVDYYNFGFSDDTRWRSYRLDSPDGEHSLYGYVERATLTDSRIRLSPEVKMSAFTLYLRFPDDGGSRNQVLIERLAAESWFIENEETP